MINQSPDMMQAGAIPAMPPILAEIIESPNLAAKMKDAELGTIAQRVIEEYTIDCESRAEWKDRTKKAMDLAMLVAEQKNYPFEQASNVKYPLLTTAALQFNARAYPAIVQGDRVAKCKTYGRDPQGMKAARADRVSEHLSYQLLSEIPEWEEDTDRLLVALPIAGCMFRKVFHDHSLKRNSTRLVMPDRLVVNYFARSMHDVPRLTEEMDLYPYEIEERIRSGRFIEFTYTEAANDGGKNDPDGAQLFLEQHRLLDLDGDGYPEPYVVTVHKASEKVCRVVANFGAADVTLGDKGVAAIRKRDYFVRYLFLPSPDGGFYGWGLGWLLNDIGESINTTLNQMLDAGHLANVQGGLVSASLGIKDKTIRLKMGEWRVIQTNGPINQAVMPITYPGPSDVLFKLLGTLIEAGKEVGAIKDVLTGDTPATAPVGTTMALIEQGLQVFTSIYKRVHRAIKAELGLHAALNRQYLDPETYNRFFDGEQPFDPKVDYSEQDMDILPVSDPNEVSRMQSLSRAMFLLEMSDKDIASGMPMLNRQEVYSRVLEAAQVGEREKLIMPPPQPNPEEEMLKRIVAAMALDKQHADIAKTRADTVKVEADAMKSVADVAKEGEASALAQARMILDVIREELKAEQAAASMAAEAGNGQGRIPGMEGQPGNPVGALPAGPPLGGDLGAGQGIALPVDPGQPAGMGGPPVASGI